MDTDLQILAAKTFYGMQTYSQCVIDFVEEVEDGIDAMTEDQKGSWLYRLGNILEIIHPERAEDVEAVELLISILNASNTIE
jgi:hypothetical protein